VDRGTRGQPITYHLHVWYRAPRRLQIQGRTVRLGGFNTSDPLTVRLSDPWGRERIDMLVITPDTAAAVADQAFRIVSTLGDQLTAAQILEHAHTAAHRPAARP
jgi:uncharacterized protein DUF5994